MHTSAKLAVIFIEERVGKSPHVLAHHGAKIFLEVALKILDENSRSNVETSDSPFTFSIFEIADTVAPQQTVVSSTF